MKIKLFYTNDSTDFDVEEIKEMVALQFGLLPTEKDSILQEEIEECINEQMHSMYNNFVSNIYDYKKKYRVAGFIVKGEIAHWNGICSGFNLADDVNDIINAISTDSVAIYQNDDEPLILQSKGTHHDGTNYYEIMTITQRGIDYVKLHGDYYGDKTATELYEYLERNKLVRPFFSGNRKLGE